VWGECAQLMIIDLNLKGRQVVIAGGGREATKKVEAILSQNCEIFVHAESFSSDISRWQKEGKVQLKSGVLSGGDFLKNYDRLILVMAATDDKSLNRKIVDSAKQLRCYAYAVDDPEISDFNHPAVMNFCDTVQVAISTGGKSPLMAKTLKQKIAPLLEKCIRPEDILKIELQSRLRKEAVKILSTPEDRKEFLTSIIDNEEVNRFFGEDNFESAEKLALTLLDNFLENQR
jgi:precorrin-2 dehydrogenase/sirohydrochlorin ferrochelatase